LDIIWYTTSDAAYTALVADEVDMLQWSLTEEQRIAVEANPNLQIGQYVENGMMEFDLNNNLTIMDYPGKTNPMSVEKVRHAIEFLTPKDLIIASILKFTGSRIDAPVCYPQTEGWVAAPGDVGGSVVTYDWNHNGIIEPSEDNYPFNYNPDAAAALLASCSFGDTDANGYLNYPNDPVVWGDAAGIDTTLMPLKMCIRADHTHRREAGRLLYRQLEGEPGVPGDSVLALSPAWAANGKVGGDFDTTDELWVQPRPVLSPIVMRDRNFHIYTGGWSFGRFPTYLFSLFHSMFWYPYGANYVTDHAHPYEDMILEELYYAANLADAQNASKWYTREHVLHCKNIPLWSYTSYVAWRKELAGIVNEKGVGTINDYTFLNAYRANNPSAPVRFGVAQSWDRLNILYSQWYFEFALLDRVYTGLINVNPYDLAVDIPWVAQDWEVGSWLDGTTEKTTVTYWLRPDAGGAAPVSGNFTGMFTPTDYAFTIWYNYAYDDDWEWGNFMDVNHVEILGDQCNAVKVYFDDVSMWFVYAPIYPLIGPNTALREQLCEVASATFTAPAIGDEIQFGGGSTTQDSVVEVINATADGSPIVEDTDYYIRAGYDVFCHNVFVNEAVTPGDTVTIYYWKGRTDGAAGTYMGGNLGYSWEDNMISYSLYYPVSISSTSAALNKNPYFLLETPLLGEVDWRWYYIGTTKPRKGNFKIDILDVVKCTGAYSSRGDGIFNPLYLPGADIDASDLCHIGILDLVTITGKYARTFGKVPTTVIGIAGGSTSATAEYKVEWPVSWHFWIYGIVPVKKTSQKHSASSWPPGTPWTVTLNCFSDRQPGTLTTKEVKGTGTMSTGTSTVTLSSSGQYIVELKWKKADGSWETAELTYDP
jgi:hypothetical protein